MNGGKTTRYGNKAMLFPRQGNYTRIMRKESQPCRTLAEGHRLTTQTEPVEPLCPFLTIVVVEVVEVVGCGRTCGLNVPKNDFVGKLEEPREGAVNSDEIRIESLRSGGAACHFRHTLVQREQPRGQCCKRGTIAFPTRRSLTMHTPDLGN